MLYEATLLLSPQVTSEEIFPLWETIVKDVQEIGASIEKEVKPFERKLGYAIKRGQHFSRAYLGILYVAESPSKERLATSLQELLKNHNHVLRFMIKRVSAIPQLSHKTTLAKPEKLASRESEREKPLQEIPNKEDKPPLADLDKKLEEILEDKIGF